MEPKVSGEPYLSAGEAAGELGITLSTLYSYVSRGLIRSEVAGGSRRTRRYHAEDVRRLLDRKALQKDPQGVVDTALHWGAPLLDSALTLILDGRLYYRGRDATQLAAHSTLEETAALLWGFKAADTPFVGEMPALPERYLALTSQARGLRPIERMQVLLPLTAVADLVAHDLRPATLMRTGGQIVRLLAAAVAPNASAQGSTAERLAAAWAPEQPAAVRLMSAALVLCADHELNVSAFTVRCVASAAAPLYCAVLAGLCALQGAKHGGAGESVAALFRECETLEGAVGAVASRLRRGEAVPGFGHPLYPACDPRASTLLRLIEEALPDVPEVARSRSLVDAALDLTGERPNIDFALATLADALGLPRGGALAIFAIGRSVGWIGHALEQYQRDELIRPRARYVGEAPVVV